MMIRVCVVSDTHGQHQNLKISKCDIFIFAGDANIKSLQELYAFNDWFGQINAKYCVIIAGNHDEYLQEIGQAWCEHLFTNAIYLQDKEITIEGLKIYGSPWTPEFNNWSFMKPRGSYELRKIWKQLPEDLDILVTHGPPAQILDKNLNNQACGCKALQREIFKKKPKRHIFGHIHECGHQHIEKIGIEFYNASVLNGHYELVNKPVILEINNEKI